jgi:FdhD protein
MSRIISRPKVVKVAAGQYRRSTVDSVAAEEPLEIRVGGRRLAVTMRTPGDDFLLAMGFLLSEGIIASKDDVVTARYCDGGPGSEENTYNIVDVTLAAHVPPLDAALERNVLTTSACGLCGKASIDSVRMLSHYPVAGDDVVIDENDIVALPDRLRAGQQVFEKTGGLHAAGLFDARTGELLMLKEDVGRHNAVDKVIGWALQEDRLPLRGHALMVSGRSSFELTQKASMAGIPILASVSAPSSLAVDLARDSGLTLIGFLRGDSFVIYSGEQRILSPELAHQGVTA